MQAFTQPLSFNRRQLTNVLITSLKLCLKWITGQNTSEWTKNHAHKHTIEYRRDTDVRVSHVPPLPSIYKVERRGWRRRENSNGFKFFLGGIWSENWRGQMQTQTNKNKNTRWDFTTRHTAFSTHCDQRWWVHATTRPHLNTSIMQLVRLHSPCKSANWCLCFFFFQTHTRLIGPSTRQSNHELSVRTDSEQAIRPVMWLDVHLERLQYASHTLHTHWNANCEYSGMTPQLTINKFI